jgi:peptidyl-prolyl cis-trans isomerase SurA
MFRMITILSAVLVFMLNSCAPEHSEIVLAKYGDYKIRMGEFEKAYSKNTGGYEIAKNDSIEKLKNFLDLYVNFKMKLRDAKVRNYDNDPVLMEELMDYKKKVGVSYFLEKEIVEPGVKDLYERRKWEIRVSHLMIRPDSTGPEGALKRAEIILDSIKQGASFEDMTKKYSHDNFSKNSGGDIFYITAGLLPLEFEDACYKTEVGKIYPEVVMTRYGAHIIKVTEKRERIPQIRASHILVDFKNDEGQIDTIAAMQRIDSVKARLNAGESFDSLAMEYSEDPGSKNNGGDLGFFERRMMVKEFDEAAFNLEIGEVSDVIRTQFGYHIIKLTDKKEYPSYDEEREGLKKIFQQTRYQTIYDSVVKNLKDKYKYQLNTETFDSVIESSDSSMFAPNQPALEAVKDKPLFSYAGKTVSVEDFLKRAEETKDFQNKMINRDLLTKAADKISGDYMLEEEALNLEKRDNEFASLMDDYKNGIFIFKLQEDDVWSKIRLDSAKVYKHYQATKEDLAWPDRVSFVEIYSRKDSLINHYRDLLRQGADFDSLAARYTERAGYKEKRGVYPLAAVNSSKLYEEANKLETPGDYSEVLVNAGGFSILKLISKEPSRLKTFDEARAEVSGTLQEMESKRLEQAYIERLKKRYNPVVFYEELEKAFSENK